MTIVTKTACAVILLIFALSVGGQVPGNSGNGQSLEIIEAHKIEIAQACGAAMSNILSELRGLAQKYPPLSDIGSASIHKGRTAYSANYLLDYSKHARVVIDQNDPKFLLVAQPGKLIIEKDGAALIITIYKVGDPAFAKNGGAFYPLLLEGDLTKISLSCDLRLSSPDPVLEKAVKDIVETHVSNLRKRFREILGIDPVKERVQAYGV
jgi:hypothetical protein